MNKLNLALSLVFLSLFFTGCSEQGPLEKTGEAIDKSIESSKKSIDEAIDKSAEKN